MKKIIILDRDGVINVDSKDYVKSPAEWEPLPQSLEAIAKLNQAGYHIAIATNQSGIARNLYTETTLLAIHEKMTKALKVVGGTIDKIAYCPHGPHEQCDCRKPLPGLLYQIARAYGITLENVPFVGDSFRDIQAAQAAKALPILVLTGNGKTTQEKYASYLTNIATYPSLWDFANAWLNRVNK